MKRFDGGSLIPGATWHATAETEAEVVRTLRSGGDGQRKRTVVMIAHRLATVRNCDCIFVLNGNGEVAESGSHDALLTQRGLYYQLWTQQQHQHDEEEAGAELEADGVSTSSESNKSG